MLDGRMDYRDGWMDGYRMDGKMDDDEQTAE